MELKGLVTCSFEYFSSGLYLQNPQTDAEVDNNNDLLINGNNRNMEI